MPTGRFTDAGRKTHKATFDLRYDDVGQRSREAEELQGVGQVQRGVVLRVVLDAVVDVRDLTDVVAAALHAEISLQFGPALQHQLQRLAVVQLQILRGGRR